jgi:hypothetical protein
MPDDGQTKRRVRDKLALTTQMRAGTHYMCGGLRVALEATVHRPVSGGLFVTMDDAEILKGLHDDSNVVLPPPRDDRHVYFSHYYHTDHHGHDDLPSILLIGFPFDSFYSDGIVYSDKMYSAGPSGSRGHAQQYTLRFGSDEWNFLSERMRQNAEWLVSIAEGDDALLLRYEDLFLDYDGSCRRLASFTGAFIHPLPRPVINKRRSYWSDEIESGFDLPARRALWELFGPSIERFYPEKVASVRRAL